MDARYILGIDELDHQHEEIEAAFQALRNVTRDKEQWHEAHARLCELLRLHFHAEESIMQIFAYPETYEHTRSHSTIVQTTEGYSAPNLSDADVERFTELGTQLFLDQILAQDMRFAAFIKNNKERLGLQ